MKEISNSNPNVKIIRVDLPGEGGAYHEYVILDPNVADKSGQFARIKFQKGPLKEINLNGCFQEDLIEICIDRLRCFQQGAFSCRENAIALTKLEEALMWLNSRTKDRVKRGVEGKLKK